MELTVLLLPIHFILHKLLCVILLSLTVLSISLVLALMYSLVTISVKCRLRAHTLTDEIFRRSSHVLYKIGRGFVIDNFCEGGGACQPLESEQFYSKHGLREKEITRKTVQDFYVFQWLIVSNLFICTIFVGCSSIIHGLVFPTSRVECKKIVSMCYIRTRHKKATQSAGLFGWEMRLQSTGSVLKQSRIGHVLCISCDVLSQTLSVNHCCGK